MSDGTKQLGGRKLPFSLALQEQLLEAIAAVGVVGDALRRAVRLCEEHPDLFRGYSPVDEPIGPLERRERCRALELLRQLQAAVVGDSRGPPRRRKRRTGAATDGARSGPEQVEGNQPRPA